MAELTKSCKAPMLVLFPVRVKSVLSAPVPLYAREMESAWFAHTEKEISYTQRINRGHTIAEFIHKVLEIIHVF